MARSVNRSKMAEMALRADRRGAERRAGGKGRELKERRRRSTGREEEKAEEAAAMKREAEVTGRR